MPTSPSARCERASPLNPAAFSRSSASTAEKYWAASTDGPLRKKRLGLFNDGVRAIASSLTRQVPDERSQLRTGLGADEHVNRPAVDERKDGRDRLDPQLRRQLPVGLGVELDQRNLASRRLNRPFKFRTEGLAGPAPRRTEIRDHRTFLAGLQHILDKGPFGPLPDHPFVRILAETEHAPSPLSALTLDMAIDRRFPT